MYTRNTLQHTATHCNTLQHTATHCNTDIYMMYICIHIICIHAYPPTCYDVEERKKCIRIHCNTLQHTATRTCMYNDVEERKKCIRI